MKLDFLDNISDNDRYPHADPDALIRLYDFDVAEANGLRQLIQKVIIEDHQTIDLASVPFIKRVNCNLLLQIADTDKGIQTNDNSNFICSLTIEAYRELVYLMEPFCNEDKNGYQWLYDLDVPIDFLFSPGSAGTW